MSRCIFVGPSLHGVVDRPPEIDFLPPAAQGDLYRAAVGGAKWIGLVDGTFGTTASVWHKEILYALSIGCHVWGAASMGALRAAECHTFGMRVVGVIALQFASGELDDDAEVALLHGPAEADYVPLTEPLVDAKATIVAMLANKAVAPSEAHELTRAASALHFTDRTVASIVATAAPTQRRRLELETLYEIHRVRAKQIDALGLVEAMRADMPEPVTHKWQLATSQSTTRLAQAGGT